MLDDNVYSSDPTFTETVDGQVQVQGNIIKDRQYGSYGHSGDGEGQYVYGTDLHEKPLEKAVKRSFADLEDDDEELFPPKKMYGGALPGGADHATTVIINLRASLEERDNKIASMQSQVEKANLELERWRKAFQNESILPSGTIPDPDVVLQVLQKSQASEGQLKEQIFTAKRREAAMLVKLANKEQQIVELKIHELGTKLAMQKSLNAELKRGYQELYDYVEEVIQEADQSQEMVTLLQRRLERKENQLQEALKQLEMLNSKNVQSKEETKVEVEMVKATEDSDLAA